MFYLIAPTVKSVGRAQTLNMELRSYDVNGRLGTPGDQSLYTQSLVGGTIQSLLHSCP